MNKVCPTLNSYPRPHPLPLCYGVRLGFIMTSILRPIILYSTKMHRCQWISIPETCHSWREWINILRLPNWKNLPTVIFRCLKIMNPLPWPIWEWAPSQTMFFNSKSQSLRGQKIFLLNRLDFRLFGTGANCHGSGRGSGILNHGLIKRFRVFFKDSKKNSIFLNPISKNQRILMWCHKLDT